MITQAHAQILLAEQRPIVATQACSTRSLEVPWAGPKSITFQEVTLRAGDKFTHMQAEGVSLILPLVGCVQYSDGDGAHTLEIGEGIGIVHEYRSAFELNNPYTSSPINFLVIHLPGTSQVTAERFSIKLPQPINQLGLIFLSDSNGVSTEFFLGQFDGRQEGSVHAQGGSEFFTFVLGGAFEVQHRLLEERDALLISAYDRLEFEALSQTGTVLIMRQSK